MQSPAITVGSSYLEMFSYLELSSYLGLVSPLVIHVAHSGLMNHSFLKGFLVP